MNAGNKYVKWRLVVKKDGMDSLGFNCVHLICTLRRWRASLHSARPYFMRLTLESCVFFFKAVVDCEDVSNNKHSKDVYRIGKTTPFFRCNIQKVEHYDSLSLPVSISVFHSLNVFLVGLLFPVTDWSGAFSKIQEYLLSSTLFFFIFILPLACCCVRLRLGCVDRSGPGGTRTREAREGRDQSAVKVPPERVRVWSPLFPSTQTLLVCWSCVVERVLLFQPLSLLFVILMDDEATYWVAPA